MICEKCKLEIYKGQKGEGFYCRCQMTHTPPKPRERWLSLSMDRELGVSGTYHSEPSGDTRICFVERAALDAALAEVSTANMRGDSYKALLDQREAEIAQLKASLNDCELKLRSNGYWSKQDLREENERLKRERDELLQWTDLVQREKILHERDALAKAYDEAVKMRGTQAETIKEQRDKISRLERQIQRIKTEIIDNPRYSSQLAQAAFDRILSGQEG